MLKKKKNREDACLGICKCPYANALPFNLVNDSYSKVMLESITSFGKRLNPISYHEVRVTLK